MGTYKKILGITSLIITLSFSVALVNLRVENDIDWLTFFVLLIPIYVIIHYLIASKVGFNNESGNRQTIFLFSSIISIIAFIIIPLTIFLIDKSEQITLNENQRNENNKLTEALDKLKTPIDLGKDTTVYNIECSLKTRYSNENLEYIFSAKYLKNERAKIEAFIIELIDSSGFSITEILVDSWTNVLATDSNTEKGYRENNKIKLSDYKEYERIKSFKVAIRTNN